MRPNGWPARWSFTLATQQATAANTATKHSTTNTANPTSTQDSVGAANQQP